MQRWTFWALIIVLIGTPYAAAQGPPDDPPGGQPTETPTPENGSRPDETDAPGERRPTGTPREDGHPTPTGSSEEAPGRAPVTITETANGFGARPSDPGSARPVFSYDAGRATIAIEKAAAPALETVVAALLEFQDEDGDSAYDLGEPVVHRHALSSLPMRVAAPAAGMRDAIYTLPGNATLTLRFHLDIEGDQTAAKYDIRIEGYPYTNATTRLAIGTRVVSSVGIQSGTVEGMPALVAGGTGSRPYLSWVANVTADGTDETVATSIHLSAMGEDATLYWAYPQAALVVHDPLVGYVFVAVDRLGDAIVFTAALLAGGILLLTGYEVRRRFRV